MNEVWRDIPGLEGRYQASTLGRIKSLSRRVNTWNGYKTIPECVLRAGVGPNGYEHVRIDEKCRSVHRLVAQTFISNPNNEPQINHLDENKRNNAVNNLEWCSAKKNVGWGTCIKRRAATQRALGHQLNNKGTSKPVLCLSTGISYPSINEAARATGTDPSDIVKVCKGKACTAGGLKWRYI